MASPLTVSASSQVTRLAADPQLHRAFRWLHLQEPAVFSWQQELVRIPAPPFGEGPRAEWLAERFRNLNLEQVSIDEAGNVIGCLPGAGDASGCILLSAHIDTVFPAGTLIEPRVEG